tara:strand:+ start:12328 stop:13344 length:1017 start_codon:yes stop_codon:yes gene_type:complete
MDTAYIIETLTKMKDSFLSKDRQKFLYENIMIIISVVSVLVAYKTYVTEKIAFRYGYKFVGLIATNVVNYTFNSIVNKALSSEDNKAKVKQLMSPIFLVLIIFFSIPDKLLNNKGMGYDMKKCGEIVNWGKRDELLSSTTHITFLDYVILLIGGILTDFSNIKDDRIPEGVWETVYVITVGSLTYLMYQKLKNDVHKSEASIIHKMMSQPKLYGLLVNVSQLIRIIINEKFINGYFYDEETKKYKNLNMYYALLIVISVLFVAVYASNVRSDKTILSAFCKKKVCKNLPLKIDAANQELNKLTSRIATTKTPKSDKRDISSYDKILKYYNTECKTNAI